MAFGDTSVIHASVPSRDAGMRRVSMPLIDARLRGASVASVGRVSGLLLRCASERCLKCGDLLPFRGIVLT